jgi:two-component system sensor histidine kinase AgrC
MNESIVAGLTIAAWSLSVDSVWLVAGVVPFWDRLRVKKSTMICWIILTASFLSLSYLFLRVFQHNESYSIWLQVVKALYYVLIVVFFLRGFNLFWGELIYVFLFMQTISSLINIVAYAVNQLALGPDAKISYAAAPTYPLTITLLNLAVLPLLIRFFKRTLRPALAALSKREILFLCGIPLMFFVISHIINAMHFNDLYAHFQIFISYVLVLVVAIPAYTLNLRMVRESARRARLEAENQSASQMLELQRRGYQQLTENIEQTRAARHDMRFHLSVMSGYVRDGKYEELADYLKEYGDGLEEATVQPVCGHHTVDMVARHFLSIINASGASTDVKIALPADIYVSDVDLCILFGNLLENAANNLAQQEGGFLRLRCETRKGSLVLTVDNSCTAHADGEAEKGIGLGSVYAIAQKYDGTAHFRYADNIFSASVILYM